MPEITALARIETIAVADLFKEEVITPVLLSIRVEAIEAASTLDISTKESRAEIAGLARKVMKSRTFIEAQRVDMVAAEKKRLALIDKSAKSSKDYLQALEDEVRKPLTDWEQIDKDRIARHNEGIALIEEAARYTTSNWQSLPADAIRDRMKDIETEERDYQEFTVKHAGVKALALKQTGEALEKREAYDAEQAELARLRQANIERETRQREERIAREATERAERAAAERDAQAKRDVEAAEQSLRIAREVARQAQERSKEAEERAERDKLAAVEAEKKRVEDARIAEEKAKAAREADLAHRKTVNSGIIADLMAAGLNFGAAGIVLEAVAHGKVRNITITY